MKSAARNVDAPPAGSPPPPTTAFGRRSWWVMLGVGLLLLVLGWLGADWWIGLPVDARATFVGRASCIQCHAAQARAWHGSDHDLAMDLATSASVLGDFDNATLEHFGTVSRMYRDGDRFMVRTEGPDGQMHDYPIKYTFGIRPLQQYLVELDRPSGLPLDQEGRLQVMRISWDTENQRWFYLSPPDVQARLAPDDPLHWTGAAQNWNHMCAACHSTDVHKNFDVTKRQYQTTFSELDVSCEACHGPGSLHVELARSKSPFWDRHRGYALKRLKTVGSQAEIETCAACHSRRTMIAEGPGLADESYFDRFESELLRPETYYCDGQVRDEVYVFGSYTQSKMYHKGVRCTDCHDPHSTRLKHEGNQVCTSCHQHPAAKYDTPAHHNHPMGSNGASCVECHMPATPFMEVDLRRDHSLRIPRPDLSVKWQTPNACTGCHLKDSQLPAETIAPLHDYADWLAAAREGNEPVKTELTRLDTWTSRWYRTWYGDKPRRHFADALGAAWQGHEGALDALAQVVSSRDESAIVRASALWELYLQNPQRAQPLAVKSLSDNHAQVRTVAIRCLAQLPASSLVKHVAPRLNDAVRLVRIEAANALAGVSSEQLQLEDMRALAAAAEELQASLLVNSDLAGAHLMRGVLAERNGRAQEAVRAYQTAIHVQPDVVGPRTNLAQLLERLRDAEGAARYRAEELPLLRRDAQLAPKHAIIQYRYGLSLYLGGQAEAALPVLQRAHELEPNNTDYLLALTLLNEHLHNWQQALDGVRTLRALDPDNVEFVHLEQRMLQGIRAAN
jgi:tetratricopeptide (TPR) repeat protein